LNKRKLGTQKEDIALTYLKENGYHIIERNFYCRTGEIDIIAYDEKYLVFVEVKYRSTNKLGSPTEAISKRKIRSIIMAARYYMLKRGIRETVPCRFDVVSILNQEIHLIKDAFDAY
jgi:putative endonuclease